MAAIYNQIVIFRRLRVLRISHACQLFALAVCTSAAEAFSVGMIVPIVEYLSLSERSVIPATGLLHHVATLFNHLGLTLNLASMLLFVLGLIVVRQVSGYVFSIRQAAIKHHIGRQFAIRCFRSVMSSRGAHIQGFDSGAFINLLDHQCQASAMIISCYASLAIIGLTGAAYLAMSLLAAPLSTMFATLVLLAAIFLMRGFVREGRRLSDALISFRTRYTSYIGERFRAWRQIKLGRAVELETREVADRSGAFARLSVDLIRQSSAIPLTMGIGLSALLLAGLFIAATNLDLSASTVPFFLLIMVRLLPLAQSSANQWNSISMYGASLSHVAKTIDEAEAQHEIDTGRVLFPKLVKGVEFRDVFFRYAGADADALRGVRAIVPAGKITAVVGPSGAGKTTFVDLMCRIGNANSGAISFDGVNISEIRLDDLRRNIAFAAQDPILFSASIADNIAYARPEAALQDIVEAARAAGADDFISAFDKGYATHIGDGGRPLSGGQRQRLALARALLCQTQMLILDEPTSSLDIETEAGILATVENLSRINGTTVVLITHRLSSIRIADHVIVIKEGEVVQQGPPEFVGKSPGWLRDAMATALSPGGTVQ
jgi:subfamily B ATP-binding cassette protein MsbA